MKKVYLLVDIGTELFLVFASKREGYKDNVVLKCVVHNAIVSKDDIVYIVKPVKVVSKVGDKNIQKWVSSFCFKNANIDTGYRGLDKRYYPVFTTKEKCLEWLRN